MALKTKISDYLTIAYKLFRYNLKIIFANRFLYFLLAAFIFFIVVTIIQLFSDSAPEIGDVYFILMFPGLLLIFYPTSFGIQNDSDACMLEIIFGIPNYRYKVWLVRLLMIFIIEFFVLILFCVLSNFAITQIPVLEMTCQLMYPITFIGMLAFMFSTVVRTGNGTSVIIVVIGLAFWIATDFLEESKWNLFLNPFEVPSGMNETIFADVLYNNRVYMLVGIILLMLTGLFNLQKRERFVA